MRGIKVLGAIAQLGEHLLCKQGVVGSIPSGSTKTFGWETGRHIILRRNKFADCSLIKKKSLPVLLKS